jgi:hypothetical protein
MSLKTKKKIINSKIHALETALETNDFKFISKWHGRREWAIQDLEELKERLRNLSEDDKKDTIAGKHNRVQKKNLLNHYTTGGNK